MGHSPELNCFTFGEQINRLIRVNYFIPLGLLVLFACEKDDICVPETITTPRLIVRTFQQNNLTTPQEPPDFLVKPIGSELPLPSNKSDSLLLPLRTDKAYTEFEFIINAEQDNQNIDTLRISYRVEDQYLNRSCGFRSTFIFMESPVEIINSGEDWITSIKKIRDTVSDEQRAHIHLFY